VRDLLLGMHPKDFDVVTDAHPEEVREQFRSCRLIGRRFRLAHVRVGREVIEVATFRAMPEEEAHPERVSVDGLIVRDNVYGTLEEDAWRRDFTVNALYYDIRDFSLVDYTGGMADLKGRVLSLIGDPRKRYREDPVRTLRAVRFAAKLGFDIAPETAEPIPEFAEQLEEIPPARLFDEVLKLFLSGHAVRVFGLLREHQVFEHLFPGTHRELLGEPGGATARLIELALQNTDERIAEDKPVTPAFLFAALLWPQVARRWEALRGGELTDL
jgi:poly(A) polymerase